MKTKKPSTEMKQYLKRMNSLTAELIDVCYDIVQLNEELSDKERETVAKLYVKQNGEDNIPINLGTYGRNFQDADKVVTEIFDMLERD